MEVLSIHVGENESAKFWLSSLNELKNRGVRDIMVICADGLSSIKEAISVVFPKTEYQRCIVHQIRNTLKYVPEKDRKAFARDLKTIYQAANEENGRKALDCVTAKWQDKYPRAMKRWYDNWDAICPIFKFSAEVRKVIYTTNAIESLNASYRILNRQRSVCPSDQAISPSVIPLSERITGIILKSHKFKQQCLEKISMILYLYVSYYTLNCL